MRTRKPSATTALHCRVLIKLGLAAAVLACLYGGCTDETPTTPPRREYPTHELTDGRTLYDDFDGNGNFQSYDNRNLAEAGRLSSSLWDADEGTEVIQDPSAPGLIAVVDEEGQRVEYGLEREDVQGIIGYLRANPRPVTAFERQTLEKLMNHRGKAIVAGLEALEPEGQLRVMRYLLTNGRALLNDRGRKVIEILAGKDSQYPEQDIFQRLQTERLDETELAVLGQFLSERTRYESTRQSPLEKAFRGGISFLQSAFSWREEELEVKYVFDGHGKLIQAVPHIPGQPYHSSKKLLRLGVRYGRYDYGKGSLLVQPGRVYGSAQVEPSEDRGWVLMLDSLLPGPMSCMLIHPKDIGFVEYKTFSADVMVPSTSTARDFYAALNYHTTIPDQPPGKSWFTDLGIRKSMNGDVYLFAQCINMNTGLNWYLRLGEARTDTWYNLRQDIITREEDPSLGEDEMRIDYYVDGILKASEVPEDAALLLRPDNLGYGPNRFLIIYAREAEGESIAFFDQVRAVYSNRIR